MSLSEKDFYRLSGLGVVEAVTISVKRASGSDNNYVLTVLVKKTRIYRS